MLMSKFNKLTIIAFSKKIGKRKIWKCSCECGNITYVSESNIKNGHTKSCGCLGKSIFEGKRIGKLTIKNKHSSNNKGGYWNCLCDCGKYKILSADSLYKKTKSCGCLLLEKNYCYSGINEMTGTYFNQIKHSLRRTKKRISLEFSITKDYIYNLFISQNKRCILSGLNISFSKPYNKNQTASLDRIDSFKGYIEGNVQWIHKDINRMRMSLNIEEFINLCNLVSNFKKKTNFITKPLEISNNIKQIKRIKSYKGYKSVSSTYLSSLKSGAKKRNLHFNITCEDIWNQYEKQNKKCYYTNLSVNFICAFSGNCKEQSASVDRIDSSKGYTKDNIVIVYKAVNLIKQDIDEEKFINYCYLISEKNK